MSHGAARHEMQVMRVDDHGMSALVWAACGDHVCCMQIFCNTVLLLSAEPQRRSLGCARWGRAEQAPRGVRASGAAA
eukprot:364189-Chlamydomonas_euryale.AAC.8